MKILIIEDDTSFALVLQTVLQRIAPKARIAETLESAFSDIVSGRIDTILLDLALPDAGPSQTLAAVRKMKDIGARVIVMTGMKSPGLEKEIEESGAAACFCKTDPDLVTRLKEEITNGTPEFTPFPVC